MAWPPPPLRVDQQNTTPQLNNHPTDHVNVNTAVNDVVTALRTRNFEFKTGVNVVTTNSTGDAIINFPAAFPGGTIPVVIATSGDPQIGPFVIVGIHSQSASRFGVRVVDARTGLAYVGQFNVNWIAADPW